MKNNRTELTPFKPNKEIDIFDIISFVKGNTNSLNLVKEAILKGTNNKANIRVEKGLTIVSYNNSEIIIGESYNPYPNKRCYVL